MDSKRVIFVVVLPLLLVPLTYGSSLSFMEACAVPPEYNANANCRDEAMPGGYVVRTCCWTEVDAEGIEIRYCQHCDVDTQGRVGGCGEKTQVVNRLPATLPGTVFPQVEEGVIQPQLPPSSIPPSILQHDNVFSQEGAVLERQLTTTPTNATILAALNNATVLALSNATTPTNATVIETPTNATVLTTAPTNATDITQEQEPPPLGTTPLLGPSSEPTIPAPSPTPEPQPEPGQNPEEGEAVDGNSTS